MNNFWRTFWATTLSIVSVGIISWLIIFIIIFSLWPDEKKFEVKDHSVLKIDLDGQIGERGRFEVDFSTNFAFQNVLGVNQILNAIEYAKTDDRIDGIYLNMEGANIGIASAEEIRDKIVEFREDGKFVYAYAQNYSQLSYFISTAADKVFIVPSGMFDFRGIGTERMFFAKALDKLGIEIQVIRGTNNKFKSAVEPFILEQMSDENRLQTKQFLNSLWSEIAMTISSSRSIDTAKLNHIANNLLTRSSQASVDLGFFEKTAFQDEVYSLILEQTGTEEPEFVSIKDYVFNVVQPEYKSTYDPDKDQIALIVAEGEIVDGKKPLGVISSERYVKAIRDARENENVKAIVLRVNSPGGSALASDVIWRELQLAKKEMPVIVSMGDVAASGGYYIACGADRIFADRTTITGSIGVFGLIPYMGKFFEDKLGITFDRVGTHDHSVFSLNKKLTKEEYEVIQDGVDAIYDDFITKVAEGRSMDKSDVDSIAKGRVWSGVDAKRIGLIDEFGGLEDAVFYTLNEIEMDEEDVYIKIYPEDPNAEFAKFINNLKKFSGDDNESMEMPQIPRSQFWKENFDKVNSIMNAFPYQMRMPYSTILH